MPTNKKPNTDETSESQKLTRQFHDTFNSESGKAVLKYLESVCFANLSTIELSVVRGSMTIESFDPIRIAHNEGRRGVILDIKHQLGKELDPKPNQTKYQSKPSTKS